MANLLDLPNELLDRIILNVWPFDLPSLAICNKIIYNLAEKALKQHLALQKRYSTLAFAKDDDVFESKASDDTKSALLFLGRIIEDPEIAYYPTVVQMGGFHSVYYECDKKDEEVFNNRLACVHKYSDRLKELLDGCDFILDQEKEDMLTHISDPWRDGVARAFLLALLPNLKSLILQNIYDLDYPEESDYIQNLIQNIVKRVARSNLDIMSTGHGQALTRLRELTIRGADRSDTRSMEPFGFFAVLPSIRALRGHRIYADIFRWDDAFRPKSSNVTEITIECSFISSNAFEVLFSGISALTKFKYHHEGELIDDDDDHDHDEVYNSAGIVEALRKHAASTLQSLDLETSGTSIWGVDATQIVGSLRMFTSLRSLRIEEKAFVLPLTGNNDITQTSERGNKLKAKDKGFPMERLVDLLPPSIVDITLVRTLGAEEICELLRDMAVSKKERLPHLRRIIVESRYKVTPQMRTAVEESRLKKNGIILSWKLTGKEDSRMLDFI